MPVNAPLEYFKAEAKFQSAKAREDKIAALEEMISLLPKHHGSETAHAQLKSKLAKLKKEGETKKSGKGKAGVAKEGEAQVCILGMANTGKSTLLRALTDAKPEISAFPYTTKKPEIGMMDYKGLKIQIVEIPSNFDPRFLSIARTTDGIIVLYRTQQERGAVNSIIQDNFIKAKKIYIKTWNEKPEIIKEFIWKMLGMIIVYTKKTNTPMALKVGSTLRDFAMRIHKDFVSDFRYARLWRDDRLMQIGLNYVLKDNDVVEIYAAK